jgi:hypothetical protein
MARALIGFLLLTVSANCNAQSPTSSPHWQPRRSGLGNPDDAGPSRTSLREAHLPNQIRRKIVAVVAKKILSEGYDPKAQVTALDFFVEYPRLAQDRSQTICVKETGNPNTDVWLFRISGGHAIPILADAGQGYGPWGKGIHHGMRDYQTTWIMNMATGGTKVLRFDGIRYRAAYCFAYAMGDDGDLKYGRREKCNKE